MQNSSRKLATKNFLLLWLLSLLGVAAAVIILNSVWPGSQAGWVLLIAPTFAPIIAICWLFNRFLPSRTSGMRAALLLAVVYFVVANDWSWPGLSNNSPLIWMPAILGCAFDTTRALWERLRS